MTSGCDAVGVGALVVRLDVGIMMLAAAALKLRTRAPLIDMLRAVAGHRLASPASAITVAIEGALGVWLLSGYAPMAALLASAMVLIGMSAVLMRAYALGYSVPCGCFGALDSGKIGAPDFVRNTVLVAALVAAALVPAAQACLALKPVDLTLGTAIAAMFVLAVATALYALATTIHQYGRARAARSARVDQYVNDALREPLTE